MATDSNSRLDGLLTRDLTFGTVFTLVILGGIGLAHAMMTPWGVVAALGFSLLYVALYDIRFLLVPDAVTLPLIALGFVNVIWAEPLFLDRAIGAGIGLVVLPAINWAYSRLRRRDGIGFGDAKLLAAAGSWLGWAGLPLVLLLASVGGLIFALITVLRKRRLSSDTAIPFGPFLAGASFALFCWQAIPSL